jgi:hypothetical protein
MKIPQADYDVEKIWRTILDADLPKLFEDLHVHQIKVFFYLTQNGDNWLSAFSDDTYSTENYGDMTRLTAEYTTRGGAKDEAVFFGGFFEGELLMMLTGATERGIEQTLDRTIRTSGELVSMPIVPRDFQRINELVLEKSEDMRITSFKSRRIPDLADADIRPEYDREIEYKGDDGRQTLEEFREYYGVVPVRVQYEHENINFKMDTEGKFTLLEINQETVNLLFELVKEIFDNVMQIQEITQEIRFEKEEVRSGDFSITVPRLSAGRVDFDKPFNLLMAEEFVQNASDSAGNFTFTDVTMEAGSLDFSARVTDEERSAHFNVSANEDSMTIVPKHNCSFASIVDFYLAVVQVVDEGAKITPYGSVPAT